MQPWVEIESLMTKDGRDLVLHRRGDEYQVRIGGLELISSRARGSEEALARLTLERLPQEKRPVVLIGGLGFGFTLRAALDLFPPQAHLLVAEVFPEMIRWNREILGDLADHPLRDSRVEIYGGDVWDLVERPRGRYTAILLDVDNGPEAFTLDGNERLYTAAGLRRLGQTLSDGGVLAFWSSFRSPPFQRLLERTGYRVEVLPVAARRGGKGPRHTLYLAKRRRSRS